MRIVSDYDGASIKVDRIDYSNNSAYLSLVEENKNASHYYNFIAINESPNTGKVIIANLNQSAYYSKNNFSPYQRLGDTWSKMDKSSYSIEGSNIVFFVPGNSAKEISLLPRYIKKDLINFCKSNNIAYKDTTLIKIELGNVKKATTFIIGRQHPGETLSSFFIEGIIKEIVSNPELQENYHFLIYPIVNTIGVQKGNHRYTSGVDFNRSWNEPSPPSEIYYLKSELQKCNNLQYFIDVHNDEITPTDYIRMTNQSSKTIGNIQVLESMSNARRFLRALFKQKKIINLNQQTAREYVEKKYSCTGILVELSMNDDFNEIPKKGKVFINDICN